jgi:hypothetical protein
MRLSQMNIEATRSTPQVRFDRENNHLAIVGQSYPENAFAFYQPLLQSLDSYLEELTEEGELTVELRLPYINTSSTKCFLMLLEKLDQAYADGKKISVHWIYDEDNESELECAEEFKEDLSLPFHITANTTEA